MFVSLKLKLKTESVKQHKKKNNYCTLEILTPYWNKMVVILVSESLIVF